MGFDSVPVQIHVDKATAKLNKILVSLRDEATHFGADKVYILLGNISFREIMGHPSIGTPIHTVNRDWSKSGTYELYGIVFTYLSVSDLSMGDQCFALVEYRDKLIPFKTLKIVTG